MPVKKRREKIVDFILIHVLTEKQINLKPSKRKLIALTCLEFGCGEILVKEILNHLIIAEKLDPHYWANDDPYTSEYYLDRGIDMPENKTFDIDLLTKNMPDERLAELSGRKLNNEAKL